MEKSKEHLNRARSYLPIEALYERHLLAKNEIVQYRDTDGMFHPSSMGGCSRKLWYSLQCFPPKHHIDTKLRNTFDHGHVVHSWQQREIAEMLASSSDSDLEYTFDAEVSIQDETLADVGWVDELNLAGRADGLITIFDGEETIRVIYELKTCADATWTKLTKPQLKHVSQASIYAKALGAEVILFQYYNKNGDKNKWFWVQRDESALSAVEEQISEVRHHLNQGTEPEGKYNMWECKSCSYYYDCRPELR